MLHDMNPRREEQQVIPQPEDTSAVWNGNCWRAGVALRLVEGVELVVADLDHGVGVLTRRVNKHRLSPKWEAHISGYTGIQDTDPNGLLFLDALSFEEFDLNREDLLRLVTFRDLRLWIEDLL